MNQEDLEKEFMHAFDEYGDAIFRFCMVKVSNVELSEDMTQEVFTKYWQYLREGKEITNTRSLLYTIANNMAKDWYKKKKSVSLDDRLDNGHEPQAAIASPETTAAYQEVVNVISEMDEQDKTVLTLNLVEGLPPREIADILGESANTISVRINRAQKRLSQLLGV